LERLGAGIRAGDTTLLPNMIEAIEADKGLSRRG
jgi:hypothetical protein